MKSCVQASLRQTLETKVGFLGSISWHAQCHQGGHCRNHWLNKGLGYSSPVFKMMLEKHLWFIRSLGRRKTVGMTSGKAWIPSIIQGHILTLHPQGSRCEKHKRVGEVSTEVWRKGLKKSRERERKRRNETKKNFSFNMKKQNMIQKHIKRDFPGGPVIKSLHFQCRGGRFNPWSGN